MKKSRFSASIPFWCVAIIVAAIGVNWSEDASGQQANPAQLVGLHGGLVVQLGAEDTNAASELSHTGRYLIHVLDTDAEAIQTARSRLRKEGHYGLVWAEQAGEDGRLPYAENLVNLVVVRGFTVPAKELFRVLTPNATYFALN